MTDIVAQDVPVRARDAQTIRAWWMEVAKNDIESVIAKLDVYGSLDWHARAMLELMGRPGDSLRNGTEAAIASYLAGKLNRVLASLSRGLLPSEDSWDDFARYAMMARYVRKFGRWP